MIPGTGTAATNRQKEYEGYSAKRKDQVELILSGLNTNIRSEKDNYERPFRENEKSLLLPQITKRTGEVLGQ